MKIDRLDYKKYNLKRNYGHTPGNYIPIKHTNFGYIVIPINASTLSKSIFYLNHMSDGRNNNFIIERKFDLNFIVTLRDPFERWVSGVTTYFFRAYPDEEITPYLLKLLSKKIIWDCHTAHQKSFLEQVETDNTTFFYLDDTWEDKYFKFLKETWNLEKLTNLHRNSHKVNHQKNIYFKVLDFVENDKTIKNNIINFYVEDYELISKINFYK